MTARPSALSTRYYLALLTWLASHAAMARELMALAQELSAAVGIPAKWEAVKRMGDLIVPAIGDFPTLAMEAEATTVPLADIEAAEAKLLAVVQGAPQGAQEGGATALAWDGDKLIEALKLLMQYLPLLLKLFG